MPIFSAAICAAWFIACGRFPGDKWDWTFAPPAPTPRILATHAWQWLICDRQHIEEPDAAKHSPRSRTARRLRRSFAMRWLEETERWQR